MEKAIINEKYKDLERVNIEQATIGGEKIDTFSPVKADDGFFYVDSDGALYPSDKILDKENEEFYKDYFEFDFDELANAEDFAVQPYVRETEELGKITSKIKVDGATTNENTEKIENIRRFRFPFEKRLDEKRYELDREYWPENVMVPRSIENINASVTDSELYEATNKIFEIFKGNEDAYIYDEEPIVFTDKNEIIDLLSQIYEGLDSDKKKQALLDAIDRQKDFDIKSDDILNKEKGDKTPEKTEDDDKKIPEGTTATPSGKGDDTTGDDSITTPTEDEEIIIDMNGPKITKYIDDTKAREDELKKLEEELEKAKQNGTAGSSGVSTGPNEDDYELVEISRSDFDPSTMTIESEFKRLMGHEYDDEMKVKYDVSIMEGSNGFEDGPNSELIISEKRKKEVVNKNNYDLVEKARSDFDSTTMDKYKEFERLMGIPFDPEKYEIRIEEGSNGYDDNAYEELIIFEKTKKNNKYESLTDEELQNEIANLYNSGIASGEYDDNHPDVVRYHELIEEQNRRKGKTGTPTGTTAGTQTVPTSDTKELEDRINKLKEEIEKRKNNISLYESVLNDIKKLQEDVNNGLDPDSEEFQKRVDDINKKKEPLPKDLKDELDKYIDLIKNKDKDKGNDGKKPTDDNGGKKPSDDNKKDPKEPENNKKKGKKVIKKSPLKWMKEHKLAAIAIGLGVLLLGVPVAASGLMMVNSALWAYLGGKGALCAALHSLNLGLSKAIGFGAFKFTEAGTYTWLGKAGALQLYSAVGAKLTAALGTLSLGAFGKNLIDKIRGKKTDKVIDDDNDKIDEPEDEITESDDLKAQLEELKKQIEALTEQVNKQQIQIEEQNKQLNAALEVLMSQGMTREEAIEAVNQKVQGINPDIKEKEEESNMKL